MSERASQPRVFVDGNNVMGSRADGWWRNRTGAALRLAAEIDQLVRNCGGAWTIVFDGPAPRNHAPNHEYITVDHVAHGGRDGADDRIVELLEALPNRRSVLVYTSDARLRARIRALGAEVAGARTLLKKIAADPARFDSHAEMSADIARKQHRA